ncbi:hypothetical protein EHQ24_03115 [Leptospira noumeaensis]|uniref:Uncharacterized protein n=1 Tax=Leptospira noumeaensis TaxID=2484964 RepID=A0A4R9IFW5_9LEPT|nr:hypothetical protein [Leptospira noumeaensis]TGK87197.1 hypothetical protein EHQ24_03115 [Leptospira noumeaensis]
MKVILRKEKRLNGGKLDNCILCLETKKLILSHIVPKWAYYWAKQEDRGRIIGNYVSLGIQKILQDGTKNYLLCRNCDQFLGNAENYIKILMHGSPSQKRKYQIFEQEDKFTNLNVELIQRFIFGILLKAHHSNSPPFHNIFIESSIISQIRQRILDPLKEDKSLPIIGMRFESNKIPGIDPKAIMIPYLQNTEKGIAYFSLLLAGWEWIIFFQRKFLKQSMYHCRLKMNGEMYLPVGDITDQRFINKGNFDNS